MFIGLGWFIAIPVLCLVVGLFVGAFVKTAAAWSDGWDAGYQAAVRHLKDLPAPRFIGEEQERPG